MRLDVIESVGNPKTPWYAGGLDFTCTECGNCCGGAPGYVWVDRADVVRIASFLKITPEEMVERYCRRVHGQFSLNEGKGPGSDYDCVFLRGERAVAREADGRETVLERRVCSVYEVRPLQCRTWPFWRENLTSPRAWDHASQRCDGMNSGRRRFTLEQIEAVRDAKDWPENPPTSAGGMARKR